MFDINLVLIVSIFILAVVIETGRSHKRISQIRHTVNSPNEVRKCEAFSPVNSPVN